MDEQTPSTNHPDRVLEFLRLAKQAAAWWAGLLIVPAGPGKYDSCEESGMAMLLATLAFTGTPVPTKDELEFFQYEVVRRVAKQLSDGNSDYQIITLATDYGPSGLLSEAAQAAGIRIELFPWKTTMWIHLESPTKSHIEVRTGGSVNTTRLPSFEEELIEMTLNARIKAGFQFPSTDLLHVGPT